MDRNTSVLSNGSRRSHALAAQRRSELNDVLGVTRPAMPHNGAFKTDNSTRKQAVVAPVEFTASIRQRRRRKLILFVVVEAAALVLLVGSMLAGVATPFAAESFTPFFRVVPIGAAIVAAVVPILFFGNPMRD